MSAAPKQEEDGTVLPANSLPFLVAPAEAIKTWIGWADELIGDELWSDRDGENDEDNVDDDINTSDNDDDGVNDDEGTMTEDASQTKFSKLRKRRTGSFLLSSSPFTFWPLPTLGSQTSSKGPSQHKRQQKRNKRKQQQTTTTTHQQRHRKPTFTDILSIPELLLPLLIHLDNPTHFIHTCRQTYYSLGKDPLARCHWILTRSKPLSLQDSTINIGIGVWGFIRGVRLRIVNRKVVEILERLLNRIKVSSTSTSTTTASTQLLPFQIPPFEHQNPVLIYQFGLLTVNLIAHGDPETCLFAYRRGLWASGSSVGFFVRKAWGAGNKESGFALLEEWGGQKVKTLRGPGETRAAGVGLLRGRDDNVGTGDSVVSDEQPGEEGQESSSLNLPDTRWTRLILGSPDLRVWVIQDLLPADDLPSIQRLSSLGLSSWHFLIERAVSSDAKSILKWLLTTKSITPSSLLTLGGLRLVDGSLYHPLNMLEMLLSISPDCNIDFSIDNERLLRLACFYGNVDVVRKLVEVGCDPLVCGRDDEIFLNQDVYAGGEFEFLGDNAGDEDGPGSVRGMSALEIAKAKGFSAISRLLMNAVNSAKRRSASSRSSKKRGEDDDDDGGEHDEDEDREDDEESEEEDEGFNYRRWIETRYDL
ncbi:hypothetical protein HDU76_005124 [Blyttiomyces sp. JEL0837]|nr:hypothetical protein HDU76_005124 [Blyttiomyces sp. JEL0837]